MPVQMREAILNDGNAKNIEAPVEAITRSPRRNESFTVQTAILSASKLNPDQCGRGYET